MRVKAIHTYLISATAAGVLALSAAGCNLFDPFDSPTNDAQILSAARACLDQGDIACAKAQYAKLVTTMADIAHSETAFAILHENNATMGAFMEAMGDKNASGGKALTILAEKLGPGASASRRVALFEALKKVNSIGNVPLRGLVRFSSAFALASHILAEDLGGGSDLTRTSIVDAGSLAGCISANPAPCPGACARSSSIIALGAVANYDTWNDAAIDTAETPSAATPEWAIFKGAIDAIQFSINSEMSVAGSSFNSGLSGLTGALAALTHGDGCYRQQLILEGVGL